MTESKHLPRIIWGACIVLFIAAVVIPNVDYSLQEDSPRANATPDPYDERVISLEAKYKAGQLDQADPAAALELAPMLKARALNQAGPMTPGELASATKHLQEYQSQIASQPDQPTRATLRGLRNERLFEEFFRLEPEKAAASLEAVRQSYLDAFGVDPSFMTKMPNSSGDSE